MVDPIALLTLHKHTQATFSELWEAIKPSVQVMQAKNVIA